MISGMYGVVQFMANKSVLLLSNALAEIGIPLQETPQTTQPYFGLSWDKGVILCSGMADT